MYSYVGLCNYESVRTYLSFQLQMNKKGRIICECEINFNGLIRMT